MHQQKLRQSISKNFLIKLISIFSIIALVVTGYILFTQLNKEKQGQAATFSSILPVSGTWQGGTNVTITGTGFEDLNITQTSVGSDHICNLLNNGKVRCWGRNVQGQLGYGNTSNTGGTYDKLPYMSGDVQVFSSSELSENPNLKVTQIASDGGMHTCALSNEGKVRCWGFGESGQLGYGNTNSIGDNELPYTAGYVSIFSASEISASPSIKVAEIETGRDHTCIVSTTNQVKCWGAGNYGQLGYNGTINGSNTKIGDNELPSNVGFVDIGGTVSNLSLGMDSTCALLTNGKVRCWGRNDFGQLGYGNTNNVGFNESPSSVGDVGLPAGVTQISQGGTNACALIIDGTVRCWGKNDSGQLGYGNTSQITSPGGSVNVGGTVVSIDTSFSSSTLGDGATCALLSTGNMRCWGEASLGQLGYGNTNDIGDNEFPTSAGDVPVITTAEFTAGQRVVQVSISDYNTCALLNTGKVRCWGYAYNGNSAQGPSTAFGNQGYGNVNLNDNFSSCGIACLNIIGDNEVPSSLGDVQVFLPLKVLFEKTIAVAGTFVNSTTITALTPGPHTPGIVDVTVLPMDRTQEYVGVVLANSYTYIIPPDPAPITIDMTNVSDSSSCTSTTNVQIGNTYTCTFLLTGNPTWNNYILPAGGIKASTSTVSGTSDACSIVGNLTSTVFLACGNTPTTGGTTGVKNVLLSINNGTGVDKGDVNLVNAPATAFTSIQPNSGTTLGGTTVDIIGSGFENLGVTSVVTGNQSGHACAILTTQNVRCWGQGSYGQLGYPTKTLIGRDELPYTSGDVNIGGSVVQLALGRYHTCALLVSGSVRCWGQNKYGQLGYGNTNNIGDDETPASAGDVQVFSAAQISAGDSVVKIVAGDAFTCVLINTGKVKCWGSSFNGELGLGGGSVTVGGDTPHEPVGDNETPASIGYIDFGSTNGFSGTLLGAVTDISLGSSHLCVVFTGGYVKCWGFGLISGQLGLGNNTAYISSPAFYPVVNVGGNAVKVYASNIGTCVLLDTNSVKCWGQDNYGRFGYGTFGGASYIIIGDDETPASQPVVDLGLAEGETVTKLATGLSHTCALLSTGKVKCWGEQNKLGYSTAISQNIGDNETPASVGYVDIGGTVENIYAGQYFTCVILTTKKVRCWGSDVPLGVGFYSITGDNETPASVGNVQIIADLKIGFGGINASEPTFINSNLLRAVTPAHPAGIVNVTVTNSTGGVATLANSYTYIAPYITPDDLKSGAIGIVCGNANNFTILSTLNQSTRYNYDKANVPLTTCSGLLPPNTGLDPSNPLTLRIGNIGTGNLLVVNKLESDNCSAGTAGSGANGTTPITCANVPVGSLTGAQTIFAKLGVDGVNNTLGTNYGVFLNSNNKTNVYSSEYYSDGDFNFWGGAVSASLGANANQSAYGKILHKNWRLGQSTGAGANTVDSTTWIGITNFKSYRDIIPNTNSSSETNNGSLTNPSYICNIYVKPAGTADASYVALNGDTAPAADYYDGEITGTELTSATKYDIPVVMQSGSGVCVTPFTNVNFKNASNVVVGQPNITSTLAKNYKWEVKIEVKDMGLATTPGNSASAPIIATFNNRVGFKFAGVQLGG